MPYRSSIFLWTLCMKFLLFRINFCIQLHSENFYKFKEKHQGQKQTQQHILQLLYYQQYLLSAAIINKPLFLGLLHSHIFWKTDSLQYFLAQAVKTLYWSCFPKINIGHHKRNILLNSDGIEGQKRHDLSRSHKKLEDFYCLVINAQVIHLPKNSGFVHASMFASRI